MLVIGLTGGIGSGKTTVAQLFEKKGITVIDTDAIAKEITSENKAVLHQIIQHFGSDILNEHNTLNRTQLRKIIFEHPTEKIWLENLLHPLIREEMNKRAKETRSPYCILIIPLLFETKKNDLINRALVVDVPKQTQIERATARDQLSPQEIEATIRNQVDRDKRLSLADDIIDNEGSLEALAKKVDALHEVYLKLAS